MFNYKLHPNVKMDLLIHKKKRHSPKEIGLHKIHLVCLSDIENTFTIATILL